ncbi:hypothetical protein [Bizionia sp. M204]|nr:hypothetical protein [Bizionia sp. M204]
MKLISNSIKKESDDKIYISIDHLKKDVYQLQIILNNNAVKPIEIEK